MVGYYEGEVREMALQTSKLLNLAGKDPNEHTMRRFAGNEQLLVVAESVKHLYRKGLSAAIKLMSQIF